MQAVKAIVHNRVIREITSMVAYSVHVSIHSVPTALTRVPAMRREASVLKASEQGWQQVASSAPVTAISSVLISSAKAAISRVRVAISHAHAIIIMRRVATSTAKAVISLVSRVVISHASRVAISPVSKVAISRASRVAISPVSKVAISHASRVATSPASKVVTSLVSKAAIASRAVIVSRDKADTTVRVASTARMAMDSAVRDMIPMLSIA